MVRVLTLLAALGLVLVPTAAGKAPPDGMQLCGATACATLAADQAEALPMVFMGGGTAGRSAAPGPFYELRWHFGDTAYAAYYIPGAGVVRRVFDDGSVGWFRVGSYGVELLSRIATGIEPFASPSFTRATVGGRAVRDPQSYVRLLTAGRETYAWPATPWIRVRLFSATPSPWTDSHADLRIARTGGWLWRDGMILRISPQLARHVRRGLSLRIGRTLAVHAKAPPDGVTLCGAAGACVQLAWQEAERLPLWYGGSTSLTPAAPAAYYVIRYRWGPNRPLETSYWVPSAGAARRVFETGVPAWFELPSAALAAVTEKLAPLPAPTLVKVAVAGRRVRAPQTYLSLLTAGRVVPSWPTFVRVKWLSMRLSATAPSPWTDAAADIRISRRGGYLLRDGYVFKIPDRLADRARRGLALTG